MPVGQVLAIQAARVHRHIYQHTFKWCYLPVWQSAEGSRATEERLREEGYLSSGVSTRQIVPLASLLMPSVRPAMYAEGRLQRDIAVLRTIEAVRAHVATHDGTFPAELRDVRQTPVPMDPTQLNPVPVEPMRLNPMPVEPMRLNPMPMSSARKSSEKPNPKARGRAVPV